MPRRSSTTQTGRGGLLTFDRGDRIGLTALLAAVAVGGTFALVGMPLIAWQQGDPIYAPYTSAITVPQLDSAGIAYGEGSYALTIADPTLSQRLADLLPGVLQAAILLAALWLLTRVMRQIGSGDPFGGPQVTRLRLLAALLAAGVPLASFARSLGGLAALDPVHLGGLPHVSEMAIPWLPFIAGLGCALLAEAFVVGARLRDDVDGLV